MGQWTKEGHIDEDGVFRLDIVFGWIVSVVCVFAEWMSGIRGPFCIFSDNGTQNGSGASSANAFARKVVSGASFTLRRLGVEFEGG